MSVRDGTGRGGCSSRRRNSDPRVSPTPCSCSSPPALVAWYRREWRREAAIARSSIGRVRWRLPDGRHLRMRSKAMSGGTSRSVSVRTSYASLYFITTGFHMAHVIVGLIILASLFGWVAADVFSPRRRISVSTGVLYWHFVDCGVAVRVHHLLSDALSGVRTMSRDSVSALSHHPAPHADRLPAAGSAAFMLFTGPLAWFATALCRLHAAQLALLSGPSPPRRAARRLWMDAHLRRC